MVGFFPPIKFHLNFNVKKSLKLERVFIYYIVELNEI